MRGVGLCSAQDLLHLDHPTKSIYSTEDSLKIVSMCKIMKKQQVTQYPIMGIFEIFRPGIIPYLLPQAKPNTARLIAKAKKTRCES